MKKVVEMEEARTVAFIHFVVGVTCPLQCAVNGESSPLWFETRESEPKLGQLKWVFGTE